MTSDRIGYIGLGSMGSALAQRLLLTHPLRVFDLQQSSVSKLVDAGATSDASAAELAAQSNIIFLSLPTSQHVHSVLFGPHGIVDHLQPGTLLVDQTTGDPQMTKDMAEQLATREVALIDAPVSGGPQGAQAGTIAIMVGAGPSEWDRIRPVLTAISNRIFHAGDVGAGHVIKLVNNVILAGERALTLEAVSLAAKNGIAPATAVAILAAGGARNGFIETHLGENVIRGNLDVGFTLELMLKDVRLAGKLATDSGVPLLYGALTREFYQMCVNEMGGQAQLDTAALVVDRMAGTHVVPKSA